MDFNITLLKHLHDRTSFMYQVDFVDDQGNGASFTSPEAVRYPTKAKARKAAEDVCDAIAWQTPAPPPDPPDVTKYTPGPPPAGLK